MKIIENGNEVIVRQYEISVNVCEFQKVKAGRIDRLTLRIEDNGGEMNLFKRVFYEETSGYGVLCIRCFHTLETIYFMARVVSADVVYRGTCKVSGPQKEVVFYSVFAVNIRTTLVIPVSRSMNGLNPGYAPRCRCDGQTPEQGFINDLLDKNPERKCSFSEIKVCGVCNDVYGLLRLIRHLNMKNE